MIVLESVSLMYNYKNKTDFRDVVQCNIPNSILDDTVAWIKCNLTPEDVFDKSVLSTWAYENGFSKFE